MNTQPEALRLANALDVMARGLIGTANHIEAASELRRLFQLAHDQHTEIYGLKLEVENLRAAIRARGQA